MREVHQSSRMSEPQGTRDPKSSSYRGSGRPHHFCRSYTKLELKASEPQAWLSCHLHVWQHRVTGQHLFPGSSVRGCVTQEAVVSQPFSVTAAPVTSPLLLSPQTVERTAPHPCSSFQLLMLTSPGPRNWRSSQDRLKVLPSEGRGLQTHTNKTVTGRWGYGDPKVRRREDIRQDAILGKGKFFSSLEATFEHKFEWREGSEPVSSTRTLQREEMPKWKGKQNPKWSLPRSVNIPKIIELHALII